MDILIQNLIEQIEALPIKENMTLKELEILAEKASDLTMAASNVKAILQEKERKASKIFVPDQEVLIIGGVYGGMRGQFKQIVMTPLQDLVALVHIYDLNNDFEVKVEDLEHF